MKQKFDKKIFTAGIFLNDIGFLFSDYHKLSEYFVIKKSIELL